MSLDDLRMFTVRLPVHSWRYIHRLLIDDATDTAMDLRRQIETGVPLAPWAGSDTHAEAIIADLERLADDYIEMPEHLESWDIWEFAAWLAERYRSGEHIQAPAKPPF